jgi:hypothetical protein
MNEFAAKKLGEVLAFAEVGHETTDRGRSALEAKLSIETMHNLTQETAGHADVLRTLIDKFNIEEIALKKAEATGQKLRRMRDLYLANEDDWQKPSELLEWSGFFHGAAGVHWSLVKGIAEAAQQSELYDLAVGAFAFHNEVIGEVSRSLHEIGADSVTD